jgi:hypothetical protein
MILAKARRPGRKFFCYRRADRRALVEFDFVPLAIVEAYRLDMVVAVERKGKAGCRILATGKKDEGFCSGQLSKTFVYEALVLRDASRYAIRSSA